MGYSAFGIEHVSKGIGSSAEKAATKLGLARRVPNKSLSAKELKRMGLDTVNLDKIKIDGLSSKQIKRLNDNSSLEVTGRGKLVGGVAGGSVVAGTGAAAGYGALKKSLNYSAFGIEHPDLVSKGIISRAGKWLGFGANKGSNIGAVPAPSVASKPLGPARPTKKQFKQARKETKAYNAATRSSNIGAVPAPSVASKPLGPARPTKKQFKQARKETKAYNAANKPPKPVAGPMHGPELPKFGADRARIEFARGASKSKNWIKENPGKSAAIAGGAGAGAGLVAGAGTMYGSNKRYGSR